MSRWSPYQDNGGSALAIAGKDYATIVADTRCCRDIAILSRNKTKVVKLTDKVCLVSCGQRADIDALQKKMALEVTQYEFEHREKPSLEALAQRLSVELYSRRFFPYYAFNILAGLNSTGEGGVYSYDAVGNTEFMKYGAIGAAGAMLLPVLDIGLKKAGYVYELKETCPPEEAVKLGVDALTAAAERNIETGDGAEAWVITADGGVQLTKYTLRKD
ncbi:proteasome subunit beta type [Gregarina niphandrodes]|uniref:Proteasome subunit beta type n=1 Tax=Gregarina niphandrodes TaxID=110365 RepID=A0A023BDF3_GRENI|nr:proteasome subunit beta type [Gregarina niphandrodes]EZG88194.1 proteasome subunit beta type [Gregarina niphandrodes]|eukprot:XP_011128618.1 proteasome subunit beta type [Gregarina niphandrodes]